MNHADDVVVEALRRFESGMGGEDFVLKDLFDQDEWKAIPVGRRRSAGTKFKKVMANANQGRDRKNHEHYGSSADGED